MKTIYAAILSLASAQAFAGAPTKIDVFCRIGTSPAVLMSLRECGSKIDAYDYGPYWCSGKIDDFLVRADGYLGEGDLSIRITYVPGSFTGGSPIEVNGTQVHCESNH